MLCDHVMVSLSDVSVRSPFFIMKINIFQGDLTDTLDETKAMLAGDHCSIASDVWPPGLEGLQPILSLPHAALPGCPCVSTQPALTPTPSSLTECYVHGTRV